MVFSDSVFLILFLPLALLVYYSPICRNITIRNIWLLFVSIGFYAWGEPIYVFLMLLSIFVNWGFGRLVSKFPKTTKGKWIVALACAYNLGILFVFKYFTWIFGKQTMFANLVLPLGISFYTFQCLSYVVDVYRGKEQAQKSIINVGLYIAFFPQLIAGPIVRYGTISKQLKERTHSFAQFSSGARRFIIGLSKKILLANQLAVLSKVAFGSSGANLSVLLAWIGALAFMLQIYFDFSGYSDMAIGLGKMFGFTFLENFDYPYMSKSISEYWRRWHISLGQWFRDYVYYPLSLGPALKIRKWLTKKIDRKMAGFISNTFILLIVWLCTGLWHGANWTFVLWGLIQFVFILWEQYRKPLKNKRLGDSLGFLSTFFILLFVKVIFNANSVGHAFSYYASMFHLNGNEIFDSAGLYWLGQYQIVLTIGLLFAFPVITWFKKLLKNNTAKNIYDIVESLVLCGLLMIDACYAISGGYNPFIYFNF